MNKYNESTELGLTSSALATVSHACYQLIPAAFDPTRAIPQCE